MYSSGQLAKNQKKKTRDEKENERVRGIVDK
jgi:hypothetical protein